MMRGSANTGEGPYRVNLFSFTNLSLRTRLLVTMGVVFIPLVVVAIGSGVFLQHAAEQFNRLTEQPVYKLQTTSRLQNQIRKAYSLVKDYTGAPSYVLQSQFESEAKTVEEIFVDIMAKPFLDPPEYTLLARARREWQDSIVLANLIFNSGASKATLTQLDQGENQVMFSLDQMYANYYDEISAQRTQINSAESRFLLIIATAIGFGLVSAVAGAMWLARSVLVPLREFEKGMTHFANDNLTYRLDLKNNNEIGRLARDFNTMAESLMEHKARLEELSSRDGLTGLYNRREFEARLREETQRARRYSKPLSVMLLDIDHFKNVNDRYGHQAGDETLIAVADLIRLSARPMDVVCRYGGEELAVILPETDATGAGIVAERIRASVAESLTTTPQGDEIQVTVSIGFATFPRDGDTGPGLVKAADEALYAAKQEGRNLVRSH
ncbi:MAG: diguanylate cyclase [Sulfuricaulis sp.]|uniref:diguanylate cyclase n=1 Tax=Sulfuricaulis sp. TaxID=2003553 RepID=UPI003C60A51F